MHNMLLDQRLQGAHKYIYNIDVRSTRPIEIQPRNYNIFIKIKLIISHPIYGIWKTDI